MICKLMDEVKLDYKSSLITLIKSLSNIPGMVTNVPVNKAAKFMDLAKQ